MARDKKSNFKAPRSLKIWMARNTDPVMRRIMLDAEIAFQKADRRQTSARDVQKGD